jgi:hypothetical protein
MGREVKTLVKMVIHVPFGRAAAHELAITVEKVTAVATYVDRATPPRGLNVLQNEAETANLIMRGGSFGGRRFCVRAFTRPNPSRFTQKGQHRGRIVQGHSGHRNIREQFGGQGVTEGQERTPLSSSPENLPAMQACSREAIISCFFMNFMDHMITPPVSFHELDLKTPPLHQSIMRAFTSLPKRRMSTLPRFPDIPCLKCHFPAAKHHVWVKTIP